MWTPFYLYLREEESKCRSREPVSAVALLYMHRTLSMLRGQYCAVCAEGGQDYAYTMRLSIRECSTPHARGRTTAGTQLLAARVWTLGAGSLPPT